MPEGKLEEFYMKYLGGLPELGITKRLITIELYRNEFILKVIDKNRDPLIIGKTPPISYKRIKKVFYNPKIKKEELEKLTHNFIFFEDYKLELKNPKKCIFITLSYPSKNKEGELEFTGVFEINEEEKPRDFLKRLIEILIEENKVRVFFKKPKGM